MATTFSTGTQSPTSHKPLEKIFDEAQSTGAICLCGRKLREYPKIASRYDLIDTISADLSKNRLTEVPKEVCDHAMLEEINCYHNVIKSIPEAIVQLQNLTFINLSRNQLVVIPPFISMLVSLEVLIVSHNKLISLPEEMGVLEKLMEIDVSCNEIAQLPPQIGDLKSLKSLNVRRNILLELPLEISKLSLRKIDFSNNRITTIPTAFRKIETLEEILLDNNPLTMPPAHLCTKGKKHIMKYLQIEAIKEDRRRGVLNEAEMKRLVRKSLPVQQTSDEFRNYLESPDKWKRHTVLSSDSGYSTTDSIEKCGWSPSDANTDAERSRMLAMRSSEPMKDHRVPVNGHVQSPTQSYNNSPTSMPQPVKTNISNNSYGHYSNNYNNNAGPYSSAGYQNVSNGPSIYQTSSSVNSSSSQNQMYRQNSYTNSQGFQSNSQYSARNSPSSESPVSIPSRQQSHYSPHSQTSPQQSYYGQQPVNNISYSNPGHHADPTPNHLSPTSMQNRYSQAPNTFQYGAPQNSVPSVNYRVIPPPVNNPRELSPEPSPKSPRTPKTPTPGYYQSNYSPSYGGYSTGSNSPNGPVTPVNTTSPQDMESEISRELQRQQSEYNRKKQQAEQIRMQHEEEMRRREEEEEKENCRRAALKVQEEQRLLLERQMEEERQREEARIQEERRQQEEAHRKEEQRKREEEERRREEEKQKQEAQQHKVENKKIKPRSRTLDNITSYGHNQGWHDRPGLRYNGHTPESFSMQYRKPALKSSASLNKDDKKTSTPTQYRRTVSDSMKKIQQPANKKTNVKNGPLSPTSSSPLISPSPSPRSSIGSAGPSPASSVTSLNKDPKSSGGSIPRRPRTVEKNPTSTSRPSIGSSTRPSTTVQSNRTTSRTAGVANSATKKNHIAPEEEFKQKHAQLKSQTQLESQKAKSHLESSRQRTQPSSSTVPKSSTSNLSKRGGTVLSNSAMKVIESYKDSDLNYTMRRQLEHEQGENKQAECLRRTIESRLKVTLPDNLPESLRDGVLLCQLANSIRPRSVTSIHVPSPAVPKLTLAKCRKNVENFIEACRKLGVHKEQICGAQDILEEKGLSRLAVTISALMATSSNPRSSAV